ncbi:MAG: hypothetical protein ACI915_003073 [Gammaproteobacteria bacterium]|jgi:hypothetical protein
MQCREPRIDARFEPRPGSDFLGSGRLLRFRFDIGDLLNLSRHELPVSRICATSSYLAANLTIAAVLVN